MLKIGGRSITAAADVLNGTELQTLYAPARMKIQASQQSAAAAAAVLSTVNFRSAARELMRNVAVPRQTVDSATVDPLPITPQTIFDGIVPAGALLLQFSAVGVDWNVTLYA